MLNVPITNLSTYKMSCLRYLGIAGTKIITLDTVMLRSLVLISIDNTLITEIDLRLCVKLETVRGCEGR